MKHRQSESGFVTVRTIADGVRLGTRLPWMSVTIIITLNTAASPRPEARGVALSTIIAMLRAATHSVRSLQGIQSRAGLNFALSVLAQGVKQMNRWRRICTRDTLTMIATSVGPCVPTMLEDSLTPLPPLSVLPAHRGRMMR